eukprot:3032333-Pyramimonas_sp.AAC.1
MSPVSLTPKKKDIRMVEIVILIPGVVPYVQGVCLELPRDLNIPQLGLVDRPVDRENVHEDRVKCHGDRAVAHG